MAQCFSISLQVQLRLLIILEKPHQQLDTLSVPYKPVGAVSALPAELQPGHAPIN